MATGLLFPPFQMPVDHSLFWGALLKFPSFGLLGSLIFSCIHQLWRKSRYDMLTVTNYMYEYSSAITLTIIFLLFHRFLSTGMSYRALAFSFRMGRSTVAKIIEETMSIIWKRLKPIYVKQPTKHSCIDVAEKFQERCNFPNVIGAVDGKHVSIKAPPNSGSNFFNYKGFFSIVLQGVADSDLKFVAVEVGAYGKESDGGIFSRSQIKRVLSTNTVQLPVTAPPLPGSDIALPYFLIGDAAYPLQPYCMTPISSHLTYERRIFNYRHSRARRCIECAFGALAAKWRVLKTTIETRLETAEMIVLASVALHNAIICLEGIESNEADIEDWNDSSARNEAGCLPRTRFQGRPSHHATWIRDQLVGYFTGVGKVDWQDNYV